MTEVLWERGDVEKDLGGFGTPEAARRFIEGTERPAQELHPSLTLSEALDAFFSPLVGGGPERKKKYLAARALLAEHAKESNTMKTKAPTPDDAAWAAHAARVTGDTRGDMDAIYSAFLVSLEPIIAVLKADGLSDAQASAAAWRVCPTAYVQFREAQRRHHANAMVENSTAISERAVGVGLIAKRLASMVSKSSEGAEQQLMRLAARFASE